MNENLIKIVGNFNKARVLVIGDIMVDHFVYGVVNRISPEAPVPVVNVKNEKLMPGGAANVTNNVAMLGAGAHLVGVVGDDFYGKVLKDLIKNNNVDTSGILTLKQFKTIIKTRVIAHNQQVVRFDREDNGNFSGKVYGGLLSYIKSIVNNIDAVIISDYGKGLISKKFFSEAVSFLKSEGKFIALDPKVENFKFYKGVSVLTPNINEASGGSGVKIRDDKTLSKASRILFKKIQPDYLLITRGEAGMSLFHRDLTQDYLKASAKKVFDVTGAGDTVISTLAVSRSVGANMIESCRIANAAASIAVSQLGTYAVGAGELIEVLSGGQQ